MKRTVLLVCLAAALASPALPDLVTRRCPVCHGRKSLSLTPPNLGQFDGEIGVTPGKPFSNHRWDVKHRFCPVCDGTGRMEQYRLSPPAPAETAGHEVCTTCWGSGVEPCRKCDHTGLMACPTCKTPKLGSKPGWLAEERKTAGRSSQHRKLFVTACPTCGGVGKRVCTDCGGKGGKPCRKCKGAGFTPAKAK